MRRSLLLCGVAVLCLGLGEAKGQSVPLAAPIISGTAPGIVLPPLPPPVPMDAARRLPPPRPPMFAGPPRPMEPAGPRAMPDRPAARPPVGAAPVGATDGMPQPRAERERKIAAPFRPAFEGQFGDDPPGPPPPGAANRPDPGPDRERGPAVSHSPGPGPGPVAAPTKPRQLQVPPVSAVRPMLDGLVGQLQNTTFRADAGVPGLSAGAATSSGSAMP